MDTSKNKFKSLNITHLTDLSKIKSKAHTDVEENKGILLTGVNGFLGIHILKELIENTTVPIKQTNHILIRFRQSLKNKSRSG